MEARCDEIQSVTVGFETNVATDAGMRNDNDDSRKLTVHWGCQSWTVYQFKADYRIAFDAIRLSAMFFDGRNKRMFDRWGTRRDTDMDAREQLRNVVKSWCPG